MALLFIILVILLGTGSLLYIYISKKEDKKEFIFGLIFGAIIVLLSVLHPLLFLFSLIGIPVSIYIFYRRNQELGKGMMAGASIGFLSILLLILFNIGKIVG